MPPAAIIETQFAGKSREWLWTAMVILAGLATTFVAWQWERRNERQDARHELEYRAVNLVFDLRSELSRYERVLAAARALYAIQPAITRERWRRFAATLDVPRNYPAILAVAYQPRVAAADLARFSAGMSAGANAPYQVHPAGGRDEYYPIAFVAPATWRNEQLLGLDVFADPLRRGTLEYARDEDSVALTPPLELAPDAAGNAGPGFLMLAPVYREGSVPARAGDRRRDLAGFMVLSFRLSNLVRGVLSKAFAGIDVHVSTRENHSLVLFNSDPTEQTIPGLEVEDSVAFGGRVLDVDIRATPDFLPAQDRRRSTMALVTGVIATLFGSLMIWSQANARAQVERRAREVATDLAASEARYAVAMETTTDGLWERDFPGVAARVSPRFEALLGYAAGSFAKQGVNPDDLVHPADRYRQRELLAAHLGRQTPYVIELRMRHVDGHYVWVRAQGRAQRDAAGRPLRMIGSITDVSDLHTTLERFRDLSQMASDWFWEQDAHYRFTDFSESMALHAGISAAAALGKTRWELAGDLGSPEMAAHRAVVEAHQPFRDFEYRTRDDKGGWHWYSVNGKPLIDASGNFIGYRGTSRDITARRRLEDELRAHRDNLSALVEAQTSELMKAKESAEQASHSKSEFLANMSHEMRTPIHAILSFAHIGHDKIAAAPPEKLRAYFSRIRTSGERLLELVNDLLDLSKLEAGKMPIEFRDADLAQLARDVARDLEALIDSRQLRLEFAPSDCDSVIKGDAVRLSQVIRNLLSNALKFTPADRSVTVGFAAVDLPLGRRAEDRGMQPALRMTVADEGIGIPEEELEAVFEKFYQSSATRTGAGGTGLGLAICREIVQAHRGTISARNRPEGGTIFEVTLPRGIR